MANHVNVNVKMYRVGELGDCFLLRFSHNAKVSNVLIDCGSFRNSGDSKERMQAIATDIKKQLKGAKLSVVVGTHQHNDHLSGFYHAKDIFQQIEAEQAWLSWLDDPNDRQAQTIGQGQQNLTVQLQKIAVQLDNASGKPFDKTDARTRINDILGFYYAEELVVNKEKKEEADKDIPKKVPFVPAAGLESLIDMSRTKRYLEPGQIIELPGMDADDVKVYVLGPPRNKKLLHDKDPKKDETYDPHLYMANTLADNFLSALTNFTENQSAGDEDQDPDEEQFPFNNQYTKKLKNLETETTPYYNPEKGWQKIDLEWLDQAERLSLYLDTYTNNSSLVLAFELVASGKFLLFVGDAQTGNWLSWKDIPWTNASPEFTTGDILANTVLYKVGHHCSHNATLVDSLERMKHPELVAMVPVDRTDENITKPKGWKMPATNLYNKLKEKTKNRVLLMDHGWDPDCSPEGAAKASWEKLTNKPLIRDLYIEYEING